MFSNFNSVHHNCLSNDLLIPSLISTKFATASIPPMYALYLSQNFQAKAFLSVFERNFYTAGLKCAHNLQLEPLQLI